MRRDALVIVKLCILIGDILIFKITVISMVRGDILLEYISHIIWIINLSNELLWPSGYELRLSLKSSRVLIPVKVIGGRQEGHPVQKCSLLQQSPN